MRRHTETNVARRLKTAIRRANRRLSELGIDPISDRVTPHSLRRTYASLRAAAGDDPVYIAEQLGHSDPRFTLSVYTKAARRRAKLSGVHLAEYDRALAWAALAGTGSAGIDWAETGRKSQPMPQSLRELPSDLA